MTQKQIIFQFISDNQHTLITVQELKEHFTIPRPTIRRIMQEGIKEGKIERVSPGVFSLKCKGVSFASIFTECAEVILPLLSEAGFKYDMAFLDPAYFSKALIGGNRGIKGYDFIDPLTFSIVIGYIADMLTNDNNHVYLMLSGARTAQADMNHYIQAAHSKGLYMVAEGQYQKLYTNNTPVLNVRGEAAASERLILFSKSGYVNRGEVADINLNYSLVRPPIKTSYPTEKPIEMLKRLILQATHAGANTIDSFAGSGNFGVAALQLQRFVTLIDKSISAVENYICPKLANL